MTRPNHPQKQEELGLFMLDCVCECDCSQLLQDKWEKVYFEWKIQTRRAVKKTQIYNRNKATLEPDKIL